MSFSTWFKTAVKSKPTVIEAFIQPQTGVSFKLDKGYFLQVIDPLGQQVADLYCFDASNPRDALSAGRSIDYNDTLFLTTGHILYSQQSKPMLQILDGTCGRHDFLLTPCSLEMFHVVAKNHDYHPSCHENLVQAFAKFDISPEGIGTTFNIFMNVTVAVDGKIKVEAPLSKPGDSILFQAKMDLVVVLTACSDEATNHGHCKPINYKVWK